MKNNFIAFIFIVLSFNAQAQLHPLTYYSQMSFGANWSSFTVGVMVGRINNDTLPDVVLTGAQTYNVGYGEMRNGKIHFAMRPQQFFRNREYLFRGQLVDFDNDGDLDFQSGMHRLPYQYATYVFENQDGVLADTFYRPSFPLPDSTLLYFAHFNSDSILDVFYYREPPQSAPGYHLQNGATHLDMPLTFDYLSNLVPNDYNKDGLTDFLQLHPNSPALGTQAHRLYLNRGDFTFDKYETRGLINADALGDFDGDGVLDLLDFVGGNGLNYKIKSRLKSADSALITNIFVSPKWIEQVPVSMDLNDDGFDDFLVFTRDSTFFCKNNGDLTFEIFPIDEVAKLSARQQHPDLPKGTILGVSYDGMPVRLELAFSDSAGFSMFVDYNAFAPFVIPEPTYTFPTAAVDTDNDGLKELCIASENNVFCAEMQSDSSIEAYNVVRGFKNNNIRSMASVDWDLDGHTDLLYSDGTNIEVRLRQADSTFAAPVFVTNGSLFEAVDFDKNGFMDLIVDIEADSTLVLLFANGSVLSSQTIYTGFTPQAVVAFDPNGDGFPDIGLSKFGSPNGVSSIFMNNGQGHFGQTLGSIDGIFGIQEYQKTPYLFIVRKDEQTPDFDYRTELFKVNPAGNALQLINSQLFIDTLVNYREAWSTLYGVDSMPDLLFNYGTRVKAVLIDESGNAQTHTFDNVSIVGVEDLANDGFGEVIWNKGSQIFVENNAAPLCPFNIAYTKQSEVDLFPIKYPHCRVIPQSVVLSPNVPLDPASEIHNLNGFINLDSIGENLWINGKFIQDLHGFDNLKFVGYQLSIGLDSIQNLEGLGNLYFTNGLYIENCPNLSSTKGIEKLKSASLIEIYNVPNLVSLEGFSGLDSLHTRFKINGTNLSDLHGLENLRTFGFGGMALFDMQHLKSLSGLDILDKSLLNIENCDSLTSLIGLNAYKTSYSISLKNNDLLENLNGLEHLERFEWDLPAGLFLENNPKLTDLSALDLPIPMQTLDIKNNLALSACSVRAICDYIENPDFPPNIFGNLTNCNSAAEVLDLCTSSTLDFSQKIDFKVFPSPIADGDPLQISLENDFFGTVKIEILSLDGRQLSIFEQEKTAETQVFAMANLPSQHSFFVRISDGERSAMRLVLRAE